MQMKWKFIYAVLFESRQQVFNKRYFVNSVLVRLSAHYNLKVDELVVFFYKEIVKPGNIFPFELVKVLKELYEQILKASTKKEIQVKSETIVSSHKDMAKKRLFYYFGNSPDLYFFIDMLANEYEFVVFIEEVLKAEMVLRRYVVSELGIEPDNKQLLRLLGRFSKGYNSLSKVLIMEQVIMYWLALIAKKDRERFFEHKLPIMAKTNKLIKETLNAISEAAEINIDSAERENSKEIDNINKESAKDERLSTFVSNAGLILLWPYLPRLFEMLLLTSENKFKDDEARIKAIFIMQYAVFGLTEFAEHELELNKLLTGIDTEIPLPLSVDLTEREKEIIDGLLTAMIGNWSRLGNTSIDGLRGNFLVRNGKLEEHEDFYQLTVEEKAYDILLNSLPWSISTVKFSWMEKGINVKWR